jgi:hypothetical protein
VPTIVVNFAEKRGNVVYIKDKLYVVTYANPLKFFPDQILADCRINVDGKIYPLLFKGWRLCDDLKYRKRLDGGLGFSGPYSGFEPATSETCKIF